MAHIDRELAMLLEKAPQLLLVVFGDHRSQRVPLVQRPLSTGAGHRLVRSLFLRGACSLAARSVLSKASADSWA